LDPRRKDERERRSLSEAAREFDDSRTTGSIGDQHYSDTKGATSGGGNATPITRKKMVDDAAKTLRRVTDTANMAPAPAQNFMTKEDVSEAVKSGNLTYGYHGTINASDDADRSKKYAAAHSQAKRLLTAHGHLQDARQPNVMVKHFLDSPHGRHIADIHNDKARPDAANKEILSRFGHFKKKYDPKDFKEETEFAEDTVAAQKEIVKANASTHPNPTGFAKDSKKRFLQIGNQLLNKQKEK